MFALFLPFDIWLLYYALLGFVSKVDFSCSFTGKLQKLLFDFHSRLMPNIMGFLQLWSDWFWLGDQIIFYRKSGSIMSLTQFPNKRSCL